MIARFLLAGTFVFSCLPADGVHSAQAMPQLTDESQKETSGPAEPDRNSDAIYVRSIINREFYSQLLLAKSTLELTNAQVLALRDSIQPEISELLDSAGTIEMPGKKEINERVHNLVVDALTADSALAENVDKFATAGEKPTSYSRSVCQDMCLIIFDIYLSLSEIQREQISIMILENWDDDLIDTRSPPFYIFCSEDDPELVENFIRTWPEAELRRILTEKQTNLLFDLPLLNTKLFVQSSTFGEDEHTDLKEWAIETAQLLTEQIERECLTTDVQKRKLEIAGKSFANKLLERKIAQFERLGGVNLLAMFGFAVPPAPTILTDPDWTRLVEKTLDPAQFETYNAIVSTRRRMMFENLSRLLLLTMENDLQDLSVAQRESLSELLTDKALLDQDAGLLPFARAFAEMTEQELGEFLNDNQINQVKVQQTMMQELLEMIPELPVPENEDGGEQER